jgi:hypothetical protein
VKLQSGQITAFDNEVDAETGNAFTAEQAATLQRLAGLSDAKNRREKRL